MPVTLTISHLCADAPDVRKACTQTKRRLCGAVYATQCNNAVLLFQADAGAAPFPACSALRRNEMTAPLSRLMAEGVNETRKY